jgi:ammonia channel protein AmtB
LLALPIFAGYGFNPGSALLLTEAESTGKVAALAAVNTSLAAASGAIGALVTNLYIKERKKGELSFDLTVAMNGTLAGLVAITALYGTIEHRSGSLFVSAIRCVRVDHWRLSASFLSWIILLSIVYTIGSIHDAA